MTGAATSRPRWRGVGQTVRGVAHIRRELPNQDAVEVRSEPSGNRPIIAAVADGHGGALHFRSDVGARVAVDVAAAILAASPWNSGTGQNRAWNGIGEAILDAWRANVLRHLTEHPFSGSDLDRGGSDKFADDPLIAYGCTLLAAAVFEDMIVYLQLGDGDILAIQSSGATARVFPRDPRFASGQTVSLCQPEAASEIEIRTEPLSNGQPALVLLSTDGYANSFQSDEDFLQIGKDYLALLGREGLESVQRRLPAILHHASAAGSADDITLAILADLNAIHGIIPDEPPIFHFLNGYHATDDGSTRSRAVLYTCIAALVMLTAFFFFTSGRFGTGSHQVTVPEERR
jgi:serine/threonine protein phosphatase PrpC